jgi:hypothetical protein
MKSKRGWVAKDAVVAKIKHDSAPLGSFFLNGFKSSPATAAEAMAASINIFSLAGSLIECRRGAGLLESLNDFLELGGVSPSSPEPETLMSW